MAKHNPKIVVAAIFVVIATIALVVGFATNGAFNKNGSVSSLSRETLTPTVSMMPSPFPTISPAPSLRPSPAPSSLPTTTREPTKSPTIAPTASPTSAPTKSPAPTNRPTPKPTPSPTHVPIPKDYTFRLKMHWQPGYFWQEETFERPWCLECTKCDTLTDSGTGCSRTKQCENGDQLWVQSCESKDNTVFEVMQRDDKEGDLFQVVGTNLCIERKEARYIALDNCNRNEPRQRWLGFLPHRQPWSWQPLGKFDIGDLCVKQHHHPKAKEVIYTETCEIAHYWQTGFWEAYN